jgi:hypothetical protein
MTEKLVYVKPLEVKEDIMSRKWLKNYGSYNHMPEPWVKIDDGTFAEIARRGTPDYLEYRMILVDNKGEKEYIPSYIYWYNAGGLMVIFEFDDNDKSIMQFYLVGCIHEFDDTSDGKGGHLLTCRSCGYNDIVYDEDIAWGLGEING